ncbi:MAG: carotenoid biosynthesis protein [Polyangiales bacterium]
MIPLELACVAILAAYFVAHRREPGLLRDAALVGCASLVGEDSVIRAYGFYAYESGWHLRVDHVPLLVPTIWAPVVLSARAVAGAIAPGASPAREAALVGALVTFDAFLIEPIAVRAGLWAWSEPGVFTVPVIGIVGWGLFAAAVTWLMQRWDGPRRWLAVPLSVLATHAMLLALWWGALRWAWRAELAWGACMAALAAASVVYTGAVWRTGARLPWRELGPRAAATGFFAALLASRIDVRLGLWAALFTPPWLVFVGRALRG